MTSAVSSMRFRQRKATFIDWPRRSPITTPIATISYYVHAFISKAVSAEGFKVDELFTGYYDHYGLVGRNARASEL